ncbi:Helix-turn-helix domain-containing protein [Cohnella sp. OV330]|uniref:response regulator transcription factor n=1 Tax=Cohnella sp. OV330 TaxID=1855288 RepID=UPI0008EA24CD|nr:response regulator [Cohnella sp. OV330]SFB49568.1 Helix-turn-helix domain-containing protein [Cohnella sp. OV330]
MYKVLLVDDEDLDLEALQRFIPWQRLDMQVVGAMNSAVAAAKYAAEAELDVLVTDIRMPRMSGLELAKLAQEKNGGLRIVFISGYEDFSYAKQALSLNACSYILKPVNDHEVYDALAKAKAQLDHARGMKETEQAYLEMVKRQDARQKTAPASSLTLQPQPDDRDSRPFKKNRKLAQDIIAYIRARMHEVITLRNAANAFSYTPNYLGLIFKEETGVSFSDYVVQARLEKAQELLKNTNLKIYEIADQVGYRNLNYFSKQFKDSFGLSPLEYRRLS